MAMKNDYAFISEPGDNTIHEIKTVEQLQRYQEDRDTGFHLTDKESEIILGYLEGHDYVLGEIDGKLYRGDLAESNDIICWDDYCMDDVIDIVCEWNYELILEADAKSNNPSDFIDYTNSQSRYDGLKAEETILDKLFDQTRYGKKVEDLAKRLADECIQNLNTKGKVEDTKGIEQAVAVMTDQIRQYQPAGRGR